MTVGELRDALEGVSDDLEICFRVGPMYYRGAEKTEMHELLPCLSGCRTQELDVDGNEK